MKRLFYLVFLVLSILPPVEGQSVYQVDPGQTVSTTNNGVIVEPPMINAVNFINYGTMFINSLLATPRPFETYNTLNYTNFGTMTGQPGWQFGYNSSATGFRSMASSFANLNGGLVEAVDPFAFGLYTGGICAVSAVDPSYLLISATNIVSGGGISASGSSLRVGVNGLMQLTGKNVDLRHSGLEVLPLWDEPTGTAANGTNFIPDLGYYDLYWAQSSFNQNYGLFIPGLWDGTIASSLAIPVAQGAAPGGIPGFSLVNPVADSYINIGDYIAVTVTNFTGDATNVTDVFTETVLLASNVVKGATFVGVPSGFAVETGYFPSQQFNNRFDRAEVLLTTEITNAVTGELEPAGIYLRDELAADTTLRGNALNVLYCSSPQTFRPAPYFTDRLLFNVGNGGNHGYPEGDFFLNSGNFDPHILLDQANNRATIEGDFAAYSFYADNLASRPPAVANATNRPGRVVISADNLNLDHTRIRGEGRIQIDALHLISSTNAVIDCEHLNFNLGSTNGLLRVQSMVPPGQVVSRLKGTVDAWSAVWSNQVTVVLDNYSISNIVSTNIIYITNQPAGDVSTNETYLTNIMAFPAPITNVLGVGYHTLMVDARSLITSAPSYVFNLRTRSRDVTIDDSMTLIESLYIDGRNLTLNGNFRFAGAYPLDALTRFLSPIPVLESWTALNAPLLENLTNHGAFSIPNEGHFGDDRTPYARFVNDGQITMFGLNVASDYFENSGGIATGAGLFLRGGVAKLENGASSATTVSRFAYRDLKLNNYRHDGGVGPVSFLVTNSLSDTGPGSGNLIRVRDGLNLLIKPATGDLLGTRVETIALHGSLVRHSWAAEDRGPAPAGFFNNSALGTLVLIQTNSNAKFSFAGAGVHNALYVDLLDLNSFTTEQALVNQLLINPNLVIYFAAARLGFTPPDVGGIAQLPEEYLDGQFGGHLRWVQTYAGPNSGQSVVVNGVSQQVNKALFNSLLIDSDGDSIPNGQDGGPVNGEVFNTASVSIGVNGNGTVTPNYDGAPLLSGGVYSVEAVPGNGAVFLGWSGSIESSSKVLTFTNTGGLALTASFSFQLTAGSYNGLFYQAEGVQMFQSGYFTAKTTKKGSYSGTVLIGNKRFPFNGTVDESGHSIPNSALTMDLQFGQDKITGTIGDGATWTADLQADRAVFNSKSLKSPSAGNYTIVFPGSGNITNSQSPFGDGYGAIKVDTSGKVQFSGVLADGSKIVQKSVISGNGQWPFYASLYAGEGQIIGWMSFGNASDQDVGGLFNWFKPELPNAEFYPDGFTAVANAFGSKFVTKTPVTGFTNGTVIVEGGNLTSSVINEFALGKNNKVVNTGTNKFSLKFSSQGLFKGTFTDPTTGKPVTFNGAVLQKQGFGSGNFLGTNQSGKVIIEP